MTRWGGKISTCKGAFCTSSFLVMCTDLVKKQLDFVGLVFFCFFFGRFCEMRARPLFERLEGLGLLGRKESLSKWIKYHRMTPKIKNFWLTSDLMFRYECCLWQMSCIWQCQSKQIVSIQQIQYLLRMSLIKPFSVSTIMCEKSPVIELKTKLFSLFSEFFPAFSYCFDQFFRIFVIKDIISKVLSIPHCSVNCLNSFEGFKFQYSSIVRHNWLVCLNSFFSKYDSFLSRKVALYLENSAHRFFSGFVNPGLHMVIKYCGKKW